MFALMCVCVLWGFSFSVLQQQHRSELLLKPWFMLSTFWMSWNLWIWVLRWWRGIATHLDSVRQWFWVYLWASMRRNTGRQSAWGPLSQFWAILEAVLLVSKAQGWSYILCRLHWRRMKSLLTFDFSFCKTGHVDAGDWSCGLWGEFVLLLHDVLLRPSYNNFLLASLILRTSGEPSLVSDYAH